MPIDFKEAEKVFRIVNSFYRAKVQFRACDNDDECATLMVCGKYVDPRGMGGREHIPDAWQLENSVYFHLGRVKDPPAGLDEMAFLVGHEINHNRVYPPNELGNVLWFHLIQRTWGGPSLEWAYRVHMDFIVNEAMYRDKAFVKHLTKNNLDLFNGVLVSYRFEERGGRTKRDRQLSESPGPNSPGLLRYNDVCVMRETDPARFNKVRGPNYEYIADYCTEFLMSDWRRWKADDYYEFNGRTITGTAMLMR